MRIDKVTIRNFKAIKEATIELGGLTVIVGANGSGKSSVLQALHWMFQSGRNPAVKTNAVKNGGFRKSDGATLSEKEATYMPSPDYRNAGHVSVYGNKKDSPQMEVEVWATDENGEKLQASMWIKSARNEGLSVHVPSNNPFVQALRDRKKEFSSYIPGLAGIASSEEKRTKLIVRRRAAAGDANTVLRNILLLLKDVDREGGNGLILLQEFVSSVMGKNVRLNVYFDEEKHQTIQAYFQTEDMKKYDRNMEKPLELAGVGFLQVIQIFAYLIYFRPVLLLVDEPDAHLHPSAQERLIRVLSQAAENFGTQIILTTHSPSVVRALPKDACVIWMEKGKVHPDGNTSGRQMMGWGLLDKRILLLTEDSDISLLKSILSQWPDLDRVVAVWPLHGADKLLDADACASLQGLFGDNLKIVLHRDRDFMMPDEIEAFKRPYVNRNIKVWITKYSDIESYWVDKCLIQTHFGVSEEEAERILNEAMQRAKEREEYIKRIRTKRNYIRNRISECRNGYIRSFNDEEIMREYSKDGEWHVILGKSMVAEIRKVAQDMGLSNYNKFGKIIPKSCHTDIASDLKEILEEVLQINPTR